MARRAVWALCLLMWACGSGEPLDEAPPDPGIPVDGAEDAPVVTCGGCLCVDPTWSCAETTRVNQHGEAVELTREVGFLELPFPEREAAFARMWYAFYPADSAPEDKPVLLFFNGGPYAPTLLSGTGTGPVNAYGEVPVDNPASFSRFANLLYVDAANNGFSYSRGREAGGLDSVEDADMFVRTLLAFLARHPRLQQNRVGLVGESYGGVRIAIMLDQIFGLGRFGARTTLLEADLARHFDAVFGESEPSVERIAEQFAYQVYIQGVIGRLGDEPCARPEYGIHDCAELPEVRSAQVEHVVRTFVDPAQWIRFFGHDLASIAWLEPEHRVGVVRDGGADAAKMSARLGVLSEWDAYYSMGSGGDRRWLEEDTVIEVTRAFVDHAALVRSLITDAAHDQIIVTSSFPDWVRTARLPELVDVVHDTKPRAGVARPGWMRITFGGDRLLEIRAPRYEAGHMVPIRAGRELAEDVEALLAEH